MFILCIYMSTFVDIALDSGLVGEEDITDFMKNTLVSPNSTPGTGAGHRKQLAFRIDTAPTLDNLAPFERYLAFGFVSSTETWAKNVSPKAAPLTVRVGTASSSLPNPPSGFYRLRWTHNTIDFDFDTYQDFDAYQDPSRYDLYVEPGPSVGMRAVTHTFDGELVPINGELVATVSAIGNGLSLANGGTIVTMTTEQPHGLQAGAIIALGSIANPAATPGVTGVWTVTGVTASTLTFATSADSETTIDLGDAALYVCPRLVYTSANEVFVRLQIDGRTAIAFTMPKPDEYGYLDIVVEQTNKVYGAADPAVNLMVRHTAAPNTPEVNYATFTVTGDIDNTPPVLIAVGSRCLPGSRIQIIDKVVVQQGIATFLTQSTLVNSFETEGELFAAWRADFPEGGEPYNSTDYSKWLNHRLIVPSGEVFIDNSTTPFLNGTWPVKAVIGTSNFTIDVSSLGLTNGSYAIGTSCFMYPSRVMFTRVTDGLRFLMDTDEEFISKFSTLDIPENPRRVYVHVPRGHNLSVGSTVFFDGAADARLNGTFTIKDCPPFDPPWYAPVVVSGLGRDHWAAFDLAFDPDDPIETMTGPNMVHYVARLEPPVQYTTIDAFSNDVPGSAQPNMTIKTASTVNIATFASKSDPAINVDISGPVLEDGHFHVGFGSQLRMDANIGLGQIEFTDAGISRAVYTVGDYNRTLSVSGRWDLSGDAMTFGIDWLGEYMITCVKDGNVFDLYATRLSFGSGVLQQQAEISHEAVVLPGTVIGETMPLQIADVVATPAPRLTLGFAHNFVARTLKINVLLEGGSISGDAFTRSAVHATRIELRGIGETLYAAGSTVEFYSNAFMSLSNLRIIALRIRDTPIFANVVYLGSNHTVTDEEDRQDVLIASLGPNRLIRANLDTFRVFSSTLAVGAVSFGNGASTLGSVAHVTQPKTSATGIVEHDYSISSVFYHSSLVSNFTCSVVNVPTIDDRSLPLTLVLAQGPTPYMANAFQINGVAATLSWLDNVVPTGNASKTNLVSFGMFRAGNAWTVLAKSEVFG